MGFVAWHEVLTSFSLCLTATSTLYAAHATLADTFSNVVMSKVTSGPSAWLPTIMTRTTDARSKHQVHRR